MEKEEILQKAMDIADRNGWKWKLYQNGSVNDIIFDHDFARAFWHTGYDQDVTEDTPTGIRRVYCWKTHLERMVLEENPLKYIEKFLNK